MARITCAQLQTRIDAQQVEINSLLAKVNALTGQKTKAAPKQPKAKADSTTYRLKTFAKATAAATRARAAWMVPTIRRIKGGYALTV